MSNKFYMPKFENSWGNLLVAQKLLQYNKRKSLSNPYINKHIKFIHFGLPIRLSDKIFSSYIFEKEEMMPFLRNRSTLFVAHVSHSHEMM